MPWFWGTSTAVARVTTTMADIVELLTKPLQYQFMVRGLLASVMVGTLCAVVGTYVVLRGMAFFG